MKQPSDSALKITLRDSVRTWLASWDFVDNPFAYWEAGQEAWLDKYYIKRPFFDYLINDPQSIIAYGKRGGGKSATRIMLEAECRPRVPNSRVLAVPFIDFSPLITKHREHSQIYADDYLPLIASGVLTKLLESVIKNPQIMTKLTARQLEELTFWLSTYASNIFSKSSLRKLLLLADSDLPESALRDIIYSVQRRDMVTAKNKRINSVIEFLIKLQRINTVKPNLNLDSVNHILEELTDLSLEILNLASVPCQNIFILIDGIDEYPETQHSSETSSAILAPLLGDLGYLRLKNLSTKFFLPFEQNKSFEQIYRPDRINVINLAWDDQEEDLRVLIRRRISAFNTRGLISLAELCHPAIRRWIEDAMLEESNKSPRDLLRLGDILFLEHCKQGPGRESVILPAEWDRAVMLFRGTFIEEIDQHVTPIAKELGSENSIPKLKVDIRSGKVFRGSQVLDSLPNLQFRLIKYLYLNRDRVCEKEEIAVAVYELKSNSQYNKDDIEQDISKLVSRLKLSIETDRKNPVYIRTVHGRGFRLENAE